MPESDPVIVAGKKYHQSAAFKLFIAVVAIIGALLLLFAIETRDGDKEEPAPQQSATPKPLAKADPQECVADDSSARCQARDTFVTQLKIFDSEKEVALTAESVAQWAPQSHASISEYKEQALQAFDGGDYLAAVALLQKAWDESERVLILAAEQFESSLQAAIAAFDDNDYEIAQINIAQALRIRPQDAGANTYQGRIERLPEIIQLLSAAHKARVENNTEAEQQHLQEIVRLDPERIETKQRLQTLVREAEARRFERAIVNGFNAVQNKDLKSAVKNLQIAKKSGRGREEIGHLEKEIKTLEHALRLQKHLTGAQSSIKKDDWNAARAAFQQVILMDDTNVRGVDGEKLAVRILAAEKNIQERLKQPLRLSLPDVADAVRRLLQQSMELLQFSPRLANKSRMLGLLLEQYNTPVPVLVLSDNQTDIVVRGVGRVGKTAGRTISLKPGKYTFEGRREGYRSKLVTIRINPAGTGVDGGEPRVSLICNELIN